MYQNLIASFTCHLGDITSEIPIHLRNTLNNSMFMVFGSLVMLHKHHEDFIVFKYSIECRHALLDSFFLPWYRHNMILGVFYYHNTILGAL